MKKKAGILLLFLFLSPSPAFALVEIRRSPAIDAAYPLLPLVKGNPGFERVLSFYPAFFNDAPSFAAFLKKVARWKNRPPKNSEESLIQEAWTLSVRNEQARSEILVFSERLLAFSERLPERASEKDLLAFKGRWNNAIEPLLRKLPGISGPFTLYLSPAIRGEARFFQGTAIVPPEDPRAPFWALKAFTRSLSDPLVFSRTNFDGTLRYHPGKFQSPAEQTYLERVLDSTCNLIDYSLILRYRPDLEKDFLASIGENSFLGKLRVRWGLTFSDREMQESAWNFGRGILENRAQRSM
ncbi:MAG TPA: hypothetical protein DD435_05370 [Cyanobacteria bacterium UBA8530]|nr:hypothetical protein [Cyanobacteria bacterium UBA8530]